MVQNAVGVIGRVLRFFRFQRINLNLFFDWRFSNDLNLLDPSDFRFIRLNFLDLGLGFGISRIGVAQLLENRDETMDQVLVSLVKQLCKSEDPEQNERDVAKEDEQKQREHNVVVVLYSVLCKEDSTEETEYLDELSGREAYSSVGRIVLNSGHLLIDEGVQVDQQAVAGEQNEKPDQALRELGARESYLQAVLHPGEHRGGSNEECLAEVDQNDLPVVGVIFEADDEEPICFKHARFVKATT